MAQKVGLIGFPYDLNSSFLKGPSEAPDLIRTAMVSDSANIWSELGLPIDDKIYRDFGNGPSVAPNTFVDTITTKIQKVTQNNLFPFSLGGDHAVTYPIIKSLARHYPRLTIVQFDAHPDLYDELDGNRLSHACPFARIMEEGLATRLIQIGIRTMNAHQREQVSRFGVESIEMKNFNEDIIIDSDDPIYVSFDLDGLDPAFAPGVSHHEPGGLSTRQALNIIHRLKGHVIGGDVVEYNPRRDLNGVTAMVAAKLVKELIGKMVS